MGVIKSPGYTINDLMYWSGMIAGIVTVVLIGKQYGIDRIFLLIGGIVLGAGLGYTLEMAYRKSMEPPRPPSELEDDRDYRQDKF